MAALAMAQARGGAVGADPPNRWPLAGWCALLCTAPPIRLGHSSHCGCGTPGPFYQTRNSSGAPTCTASTSNTASHNALIDVMGDGGVHGCVSFLRVERATT